MAAAEAPSLKQLFDDTPELTNLWNVVAAFVRLNHLMRINVKEGGSCVIVLSVVAIILTLVFLTNKNVDVISGLSYFFFFSIMSFYIVIQNTIMMSVNWL